MAAKRTPGTGYVIDLWKKADGSPTKDAGKGKQWRGVFINVREKPETQAFSLKREAQKWVNARRDEFVAQNHTVRAEATTPLRAFHEVWKPTQTVKPAVKQKRSDAWNGRVEARWGDVSVGDITPLALRTWIAELLDSGVGADSVIAAFEVLRPVLDLAVEKHAVGKNPARGLTMPKPEPKRKAYLTHGQVETLACAFTRPEDQVLVRFLAYSGVRFGEAAALRGADLALPRVTVTRGITEVSGKIIEAANKSWEQRSLTVPEFLVEELADLARGRTDLLFYAPRGGYLRINTWRSRTWGPSLKKALKADPTIPAENLTPHALRHTAASLAVQAGANVKGVQRMLGHRSAAMTLDRYADLFDSDLVEVAGRLHAAREQALAPRSSES